MDYDTKLGEWFKELERKKEELRARKMALQSGEMQPPLVNSEEPREQAPSPPIDAAPQVTNDARSEAQGGVATVEAPPALKEEEQPRRPEPAPVVSDLFEEPEAPQVEDFLTFLDRPAKKPEIKPQAEEQEQGHLGLYEGTGEPRPIPVVQEPEPQAAAVPHPTVIKTEAPKAEAAAPAPVAPPAEKVDASPVQADTPEGAWARLPSQLQNLIESAQVEVAQHSYKTFKESRAGLIQRLLDPPITLEEAARILNVCPTTVRRYTNRGVLKHFRTAGNQRRFRLSDVLSFMESQMGRTGRAQ